MEQKDDIQHLLTLTLTLNKTKGTIEPVLSTSLPKSTVIDILKEFIDANDDNAITVKAD